MDGRLFDQISSKLARANNRRGALRLLAGATLGAAFSLRGGDADAAPCVLVGKACNRAKMCCQGATCEGGRCRCRRDIACHVGQEIDPDTCRCRCPRTIVCPVGEGIDPKTCRCRCADAICPVGQEPDPKTCRCRCTFSEACIGGEKLDPNTCQCYCPISSCPAGQIFHPEYCLCSDI